MRLVVIKMAEPKISNEILDIIRIKSETSPEEKIRVIISLDKSAPLEDAKRGLAACGLEIGNVLPEPVPVIFGSVSLKDISKLGNTAGVKRVELDSEVYAL